MPVRRNVSRLTAAQRTAFVTAVLELKRRGGYDALVQIHFDRMTADSGGQRVGHQSPSFLPWHRRFLLDFERRLQAIDPAVTVPYWNWTVDRTPAASLWGADFLGGDGQAGDHRVVTGPFAYDAGNWPLTVRVDSRPYLVRAMGLESPTLPTAIELTTVRARTPYDVAPWSEASTTGFRAGLEGFTTPNLHNRVHLWVGGQMLQTVSPTTRRSSCTTRSSTSAGRTGALCTRWRPATCPPRTPPPSSTSLSCCRPGTTRPRRT